ncbi:DUF2474 domain-containing protein [Cupriavidus sp. 2KB_3]
MNAPITPDGHGTTFRRIGWMVLIWACSVAALGVVALTLRLLMTLAGMTR